MSEFPFHFDFEYLNFEKLVGDDIRELYMPSDFHHFFNTSVVKLYNDTYLYAVRMLKYMNLFNSEFKPGNSPECEPPIDSGINFVWNRWGPQRYIVDSTIFLIGNHKKGQLDIAPIPIREMQLSDVRLGKIDNIIYLHDGVLERKYRIEIVDDGFRIVEIDRRETRDTSESEVEKNRQIISMKSGRGMEAPWPYVLDGFYKNYKLPDITIPEPDMTKSDPYGIGSDFNSNDKGGVSIRNMGRHPRFFSQKWIRFENYVIDGKGSYDTNLDKDKTDFGDNYGITPLFSFSTPHIYYSNESYNDALIGVGHLKIHSDITKYPYISGSNIDKFRKHLYRDMKGKYGDRYIRHYGTQPFPNCGGYIYMLYFYILYDKTYDDDGSIRYNSMKLSDGFLPISLDDRSNDKLYPWDEDYKFSLIFPMGLAYLDDNKERILVTAGYGDFYPVALEFDTKNIVDMCEHDVKNMNMKEYNYWILAKYKNKSYISGSFNNILETISQI